MMIAQGVRIDGVPIPVLCASEDAPIADCPPGYTAGLHGSGLARKAQVLGAAGRSRQGRGRIRLGLSKLVPSTDGRSGERARARVRACAERH